jgi:DNA-binding NarL/FixJ family response regulator
MATADEVLLGLVDELTKGTTATTMEKHEIIRMANGLRASTSATASGLSRETIRSRRKKIYRKLQVGSHEQVTQKLLSMALTRLAAP